jgi:hypothetical protein
VGAKWDYRGIVLNEFLLESGKQIHHFKNWRPRQMGCVIEFRHSIQP